MLRGTITSQPLHASRQNATVSSKQYALWDTMYTQRKNIGAISTHLLKTTYLSEIKACRCLRDGSVDYAIPLTALHGVSQAVKIGATMTIFLPICSAIQNIARRVEQYSPKLIQVNQKKKNSERKKNQLKFNQKKGPTSRNSSILGEEQRQHGDYLTLGYCFWVYMEGAQKLQ